MFEPKVEIEVRQFVPVPHEAKKSPLSCTLTPTEHAALKHMAEQFGLERNMATVVRDVVLGILASENPVKMLQQAAGLR